MKSHRFGHSFGHHVDILLAYVLYLVRHLFLHRCLTVPFSDFGLSLGSFGAIFSSLDRKWFPKWSRIQVPWPPLRPLFGTLFRDLFRTLFFRCILVELWLPFTSLWLPFDSLLVPFGSLLVPLSLDFFHFWWLLASFFIWTSVGRAPVPKLFSYSCIQGGAFLIFCSYFEATRMSIVVEGVASDEWTSNLGILEGSVLAILLAALYLTGLVQYRTRRRRRSLVGRQWDHSVHKRALL